MQTIDAINEMIGYVGESPLDPSDSDYTSHPLYESALRILTSTSRMVQARGWWFNRRATTLTPASGTITIDPDAILAVAIKNVYGASYAVRAGVLYDLTNGTATITSTLDAVVIELLAFEDLPESAAEYIKEYAAVRFVQTYDGDRSKLAEVKENRSAAFIVFNSEHIREAKVNVFETASMGPIIANNWHTRYRIR